MDHTFKAANKAIVVTPDKKRVKVMKGGLLNVLNEESEILAWVSFFENRMGQKNSRTNTMFSVFVRHNQQQRSRKFLKV